MNVELSSKLAQVIEQIPKDVRKQSIFTVLRMN